MPSECVLFERKKKRNSFVPNTNIAPDRLAFFDYAMDWLLRRGFIKSTIPGRSTETPLREVPVFFFPFRFSFNFTIGIENGRTQHDGRFSSRPCFKSPVPDETIFIYFARITPYESHKRKKKTDSNIFSKTKYKKCCSTIVLFFFCFLRGLCQ